MAWIMDISSSKNGKSRSDFLFISNECEALKYIIKIPFGYLTIYVLFILIL